MKIELRSVPAPEFAFPKEAAPIIPAQEYEARLAELYARAEADWVVVYSDREHHTNLTYLLNYDPRFEEALLVLGKGGRRVLIVGNEGLGYLSQIPVAHETMLCQTFSLSGQPRSTAANLEAILRQIGLAEGSPVAVAGWKYLEADEFADPSIPAFVPALILETLRRVTSRIWDATPLLMHPQTGMFAQASAHQIALCEWAARHASAAVFGVIHGARPGQTELEAAQEMRFSGLPLTMHPIFTSGSGAINGLRSPSARRLVYGDALSTAVGYRGSLCCRSGMLSGEVDPSFLSEVVAPYFNVIATWYQVLRLGAVGKEIWRAVETAFAGTGMHSALNPGHLTLIEEWSHSPIRPESTETIHSGMVFQVDIIPTPVKTGWLMNCEDTLAFADASLRAEIQTLYPQLWSRIQKRRSQMRQLGLTLGEEILPLSDGAAYLPPFWLAPELVCVVSH
ncbi:MAG: Xaa-Pro aminopeptidase [Anaerolineaceae bacterium]|nr:Xaa-Pro aminopeptidase [Anaerolineaceae bacterium]